MNDPDWRGKVEIGEARDGMELVDEPPDVCCVCSQPVPSDESADTDAALQQLTDYWCDHVYEAAYDALSGFCGEGEARTLAGEIVSRLREKMEGEDE